MITITDAAITKIKEIAENEGLELIVRVGVKGGSCAGFVHDMYFDDQIKDTDEIIERDSIKIIIDQMSWQYLENVSIDYEETLMGGGFKFNSPDIKATCGCGKSVAY